APVAAMAETGIETLATDDADFSRGTVEWRSGEPGDEFAYTGYYTGLVPKTITTVSGQEYDLELEGTHVDDPSDHAFFYYVKVDSTEAQIYMNGEKIQYRDADGNIKDLVGTIVTDDGTWSRPTDPGTYAVVIYTRMDGDNFAATVADSFTIANPDFSDALIYDGDDQTDTEFAYTGADDSAQVQNWIDRINVSVNGEKLVKGTDYDLEIWEKGGAGALATNTTLKTGTTYIVKVIGQGRFAGEKAEKEFTFGKLDLSDAVVEGEIVLAGGTIQPDKDLPIANAIKSVNGIDWADLSNQAQTHMSLEFVSDPDGNQTFNKKEGVYTYKVTGSGDYLTGSATVKVVYASKEAAVDMTGCTTAWKTDANGDNYALVDLSRNTVNFDLSKVKFYDGTTELDLDEDEYTVTVTKQDGTEATVADLKTPGTYYVKVSVWAKNSDGTYTAGSQVEKVVVSYENVTKAGEIFFSYDGENCELGANETYSGKNFLEDVAVKVVVDNATLTEGTDYTVTYYKVNDDDSRTAVEQIVDAGEYVVVVKGITFDNGNGTEFYFDVDKATPEIRVNYDLVTDEETGDGVYNYTGEAITPTFTFLGVDGEPLELTADDYTADYTYFVSEDGKTRTDDVDEVKAAGTYTAKIKLADTVANYAYDATARHHADASIEIEV
ncbi:hypothetical protein, partial [Collinsella ihumii]|uniref:hypothetical protein n=1 Tax=Collinsella ihumii TaxID=1720204 RepID=UPI0025AB1986